LDRKSLKVLNLPQKKLKTRYSQKLNMEQTINNTPSPKKEEVNKKNPLPPNEKAVKPETPKQTRKLKRLTYTLVAIIVFILASTSILIITNQGKRQAQPTQNTTPQATNPELTTTSTQDTEWKLYTNLQYGFQFQFPTELSTIPKDETPPGFIPVCTSDNLICVTYSGNPYPKSGFESAGFSVQTIPNIEDEISCATFPDNENSLKLDKTKTINGIKFYYGDTASVATGHQSESVIYRTFHYQVCFEIDQNISTSSCEVDFPELCPNKFTSQDKSQILSTLNQIILTFKFSGSQQSVTREPSSRESGGCIISGCSSEICSDKIKFSTCEVKPGVECYKTAACERQEKGECGWTQTEELTSCLSNTQQNDK
jgi:hypothetical protein